MIHYGTQVIETERLVLRRFTMDDGDVMFYNWASDPEVSKYLRWNAHTSWAESAEYLNMVAEHYSEPDFYNWGITEKVTGILFGNISIQRAEPDSGWTFPIGKLGEVWEPGYCIGRKWWNKGYTTEALCAVRDFWFGNVEGKWLSCCHAKENTASGAVMQKAGFRYDHDAVFHKFDGSSVDCQVYVLLNDGSAKRTLPLPAEKTAAPAARPSVPTARPSAPVPQPAAVRPTVFVPQSAPAQPTQPAATAQPSAAKGNNDDFAITIG